jgi:hypothetical protein
MMKKSVYFLLISAVLFMLAACGGGNSTSSAPTAKTTVLVYIEGTDLEAEDAQATANINEMLAASSAAHLNVVLTTGAANKAVATDPVKSWKTVKRHQIKDGKIVELADLGVKDMGTTDVLTDFIKWGQTSFPADKYVLVFWDHGGGTNGGYGGYSGAGDETTKAGNLSVSELQQAIRDAVAVTGKKFELIGFDACLMATAEIAYYLEPYARYLVASEELEPSSGWNYTPFLTAIAQNPAVDGLAIGKAIADAYAAKAEKESYRYTISVTDLSQTGGLLTAIVQLSEAISTSVEKAGRTAWNLVAGVRSQADEYGADYINRSFTNQVDIGHFAQLLGGVADTSWHAPAAALQSIIGKAVRYNRVSAAHEASTGLSIFFPFHNFEDAKQEMLIYAKTPFNLQYYEAMSWFVQFPLENPPGTGFAFEPPTQAGTVVQAVLGSPFAVAEKYAVVTAPEPGSPDVYMLLGMDIAASSLTGVDTYTLSYTRTNTWFTLEGEPVSVFFESILKDGRYVISIPVYYRAKGSTPGTDRPVNLAVLYDPKNNTGEIKSAWEGIQADGTASRVTVDINKGDFITPVFQVVNTATVPETISYMKEQEFELKDEALTFSRTAIPAGNYQLGFQVRDLAGNVESSKAVAFTVGAVPTKATVLPKQTPVFLRTGFWSALR